MLRTRTSQDLRWGSKPEPKKLKASFLEAENDFVRRSSGKNEVGLEGLGGRGGCFWLKVEKVEVLENRALMAEAEEVEGRREEEEGLLLAAV